MSEANQKDYRSIADLIKAGSEIAGGVSGAVIGGTIIGPAGWLIGGASGPIITRLFTKIGNEIKKRVLGDREESRIGFTYTVGLLKIKSRLEKGEKLRSDGFFESDEFNRSASEEILEGVLRSSQVEYQEKKLPYYGNLLANIAFETSISRNKANLFLRIAQNLSYQQLCILQLVSQNEKMQLNWGYEFMRFDELQKFNCIQPAIEELGNNKLLYIGRQQEGYITSIRIIKLGQELIKLMELSEIAKSEISSLDDEFSEIQEIIKKLKVLKDKH